MDLLCALDGHGACCKGCRPPGTWRWWREGGRGWGRRLRVRLASAGCALRSSPTHGPHMAASCVAHMHAHAHAHAHAGRRTHDDVARVLECSTDEIRKAESSALRRRASYCCLLLPHRFLLLAVLLAVLLAYSLLTCLLLAYYVFTTCLLLTCIATRLCAGFEVTSRSAQS